MADEVTVDLDRMTLGDLEDLAEFIGPERMAALEKGAADPKTMVGLAWIMKRQENPAFTLEDARALPLSALSSMNGNGSRVDPTEPDGSGNLPPSASPPA